MCYFGFVCQCLLPMPVSISHSGLQSFRGLVLRAAHSNMEMALGGGNLLKRFTIPADFDDSGDTERRANDGHFGFQFSLVLDYDFAVDSASAHAPNCLGVSSVSLIKKPFADLLAPESRYFWQFVTGELLANTTFNGTFALSFLSHSKIILPALCHVIRLTHSGRAVVHAYLVLNKDEFVVFDAGTENAPDMQRWESVCRYILDHLDKPLPSAFALAKMAGTNDHTLKAGFRKTFGSSLYQFYLSEKLKRSRLFIEQSNIPLHRIAADMGFGSYSNFSRAFRKKFGIAPSELKRWDDVVKE